VINRCNRRINHIWRYLLYSTSSQSLLYLECHLLPVSHKMYKNIDEYISLSLRTVIRLSQWFITLCLRLYCIGQTTYNTPSNSIKEWLFVIFKMASDWHSFLERHRYHRHLRACLAHTHKKYQSEHCVPYHWDIWDTNTSGWRSRNQLRNWLCVLILDM
jgi:hypothetical protein